jgi:hypothetical protein
MVEGGGTAKAELSCKLIMLWNQLLLKATVNAPCVLQQRLSACQRPELGCTASTAPLFHVPLRCA